MQEVPSAVQTQIAAEASKPLITATIGLDAGDLRFVAAKSNIVFPTGGNTYTAKYFTVGNKVSSINNQLVKVDVSFDNVLGDMWGYNAAETFVGKTLEINKIYYDILSDSSYYRQYIKGYIDSEPNPINKNVLTVTVTQGKKLGRKLLQEYFQRSCNRIFGDTICNSIGRADLSSLQATGTADSGTASSLTDNALTQVDDYWKYGKILITISGITHTRRVASFNASTDTITFDSNLHVPVSNGDSYTVYKGCSNTRAACSNEYSYGPSADNHINFKGFIHIGKVSERYYLWKGLPY